MPSSDYNPVDWDAMPPEERAEKEEVLRQLEVAREGKVPLALPGGRELPREQDPHYDVRRILLNEKRKIGNLLHEVVEAKRVSTTDALTGLPNKRSFLEALPHAIVRANRAGKNVYLVMMDMDHFKKVNDDFGHDAGDVVLKELAGILKSLCRTSEKPFRWGGEEFAVILDADDDAAVSTFCERVNNAVSSHKFKLLDGRVIHKTISIGFSSLKDYDSDLAKDVRATTGLPPRGEDSGKTIDEEIKTAVILKLADNALLAAKESGRNRVVRAGDPAYLEHVKLDHGSGTAQADGAGN